MKTLVKLNVTSGLKTSIKLRLDLNTVELEFLFRENASVCTPTFKPARTLRLCMFTPNIYARAQ